MRFRTATSTDIEAVAALHADSWSRFYRGAYSDEYLDGAMPAERLTAWTARLTAPEPRHVTIVAEPEPAGPAHPEVAPTGAPHTGAAEASGSRQELAGFVHLVVDEDPRWGSLVDNLHVTNTRRRGGLGSALLARAARAAAERGTTAALYLWVQEQNAAAQAFYTAHGGQVVERARVSDPGGIPGRLNGNPLKLRVTWPDAALVARRH
ncbi:GNAT family N-acetyltransferase [Asanoa sp. NPDC049518]|uniref:GNAT family N-acetyltransferase n=1 Tax=unclassified Asanoa TaxID=2685164 RepID=UPI0034477E76